MRITLGMAVFLITGSAMAKNVEDTKKRDPASDVKHLDYFDRSVNVEYDAPASGWPALYRIIDNPNGMICYVRNENISCVKK